jgi:Fe-S oxidoreductase
MAGSFGFEQHKYAMSQTIGERVLLPRVRKADPGTLVIADGFSCREQIRQGTRREALHLAQVLQRALREGAPAPADVQPPKPARRKSIGAHA